MSLNRRGTVVAGTLLAVTVFGSAAAWSFQRGTVDLRTSQADPKSYSDVQESLHSSGNVDEITSGVLDTLDPGLIHNLRLAGPPTDVPRTGLWMYATVAGDASNEVTWLLPFWEANLAQGAIADQLAKSPGTDLANVVSGATVTLEDAAHTPLPADAGDVAAGQVFTAQAGNWSDDEIDSRVRDSLKPFGLTPSVHVLRPIGPAVEIVATVTDQKLVAGRFQSIMDAIQQDSNYEGVYLELRDGSGDTVAVASSAFRTGGGVVWFKPGYDEILDIGYGGNVSIAK